MATKQPFRLAHLHIPTPILYEHSLRLQEAVLTRHFTYRDSLRVRSSLHPPATPAEPPPTLLTFSTTPTYTVGRRHLQTNPISLSQRHFLTSPHNSKSSRSRSRAEVHAAAEFHPSPRGGLLTYHAPGQLTAYPIIDLRRHGITPRCYVRMLEKSVIRTCARVGVPNVGVTDDPGVWIVNNNNQRDSQTGTKDEGPTCAGDTATAKATGAERKICAVGVQISRGITSHGIGLNVFDAPIPEELRDFYTLPARPGSPGTMASASEFGRDASESTPHETGAPTEGYLSWGFSRIVACGLEGKSVTWLSREQQQQSVNSGQSQLNVEDVARVFAEEFAHGLNSFGNQTLDGISPVEENEILVS